MEAPGAADLMRYKAAWLFDEGRPCEHVLGLPRSY
jgi:hypothetical protein